MTGFRLDHGGAIDRGRAIRFRFNGREHHGFAGDTLASALIASGVSVVARSFKYHRPRGIVAHGIYEPNAIVQLGTGESTVPNVQATRIALAEGLEAASVNAWPSVDFDLGAINDRLRQLLVAGFYYKTFMWPNWHLFEPFIRRAAGLGRAPALPDPDRYEARSVHADVVVVGAGAAGLMAARAAADAGARVLIVEADSEAGGSLLGTGETIDGVQGRLWAANMQAALSALPNVRMLLNTAVIAYHDHNFLLGVENVGRAPRERLWKVRARQVVLATGASERPIVFANNDRPGIMLADGILGYVTRYGVAPGRKVVFFTTNDSAYRAAFAAHGAGIAVTAIVDARPAVSPGLRSICTAKGIEVLAGSVVCSAAGVSRVSAVDVSGPAGKRRIACDLVGMSGGWSPAVQLFSQSGGILRYDETISGFVPDRSVQAERSCGAAAGRFGRQAALDDGWARGAAAAAACGFDRVAGPSCAPDDDYSLIGRPLWQVPATATKTAFVDTQADVTIADLELAVRENYQSIEHVKRYTTLGMGTDQGKLANVNAIGVLAEIMAVAPGSVGTTRFRPPTLPVSLGAFAAGKGAGDLFLPRRTLPAHDWHERHGALFEDFGWDRPAAYPAGSEDLMAAARREALAVRNAVGLLDGSPLGKIEIRGSDAAAFLDRIYVGAASSLKPGRVRYGLMLNENGTIIDDGVFARLADDHFLLNPSSSHAERTMRMLEDVRQCEWPMDIVIQDVTTQWAVWTVAGPKARDVIAAAGTDIAISRDAFPHLSYRTGMIAGLPVRVQRVSFSGELSYEISVAADRAEALADALMAAGRPHGIALYGIEALEILRTEKGYIHVGGDTDSNTQPADIGMGRAIANKASDFIGRRSLMRPASASADRLQLVGLSVCGSDEALPAGAHIRGSGADPSDGFVTSSYASPTLGRGVALGLLRGGHARAGEIVTVFSLGREWQAQVTDPVAYDPAGERLHD